MHWLWWFYIAGCLWGVRAIAWALILEVNHGNRDYIEGGDYIFGTFFGVGLCWSWPLFALGRSAIYVWRRIGGDTLDAAPLFQPLGDTIRERAERKRLQAIHELDERERRIRAAERELGLEPFPLDRAA